MSASTPPIANRDIPIRSSVDPTESSSIRNEWKRELETHVQQIKRDIRKTIVENDAFRLRARDPTDGRTQDDLPPGLIEYWHDLHANDVPVRDPQPEDLGSVEDAVRLDQLDKWLDYVYEQRLVRPMELVDVRDGKHWTADYLQRAYVKGDRLAVRDLKRSGFDISAEDPNILLFDARRRPVLHREYSETYHDLEYIANDMKRDSHRAAADALDVMDEPSPTAFYEAVVRPLVRQGSNRLGNVVDVRAVETVNRAMLMRFADTQGVDTLGVMVEETPGAEAEANHTHAHAHAHAHAHNDLRDHVRRLLGRDQGRSRSDDAGGSGSGTGSEASMRHETAGDRKVCPECASLGGRVVSVDDALRGGVVTIPVHVNCRCRWVFESR